MSAIPNPSVARAAIPPDTRTSAAFAFYYVVYLVVVLSPTALLLGFFCMVVPRFKEIFKDFKTSLPGLTTWLLIVADFIRSGWWIPIAFVALALPLLLAWMTSRQPYRVYRVISVLIAIIVMLTSSMFTMVCGMTALFLPLIKLIQSVSGGEGGGN
jgi:hypothetical protein